MKSSTHPVSKGRVPAPPTPCPGERVPAFNLLDHPVLNLQPAWEVLGDPCPKTRCRIDSPWESRSASPAGIKSSLAARARILGIASRSAAWMLGVSSTGANPVLARCATMFLELPGGVRTGCLELPQGVRSGSCKVASRSADRMPGVASRAATRFLQGVLLGVASRSADRMLGVVSRGAIRFLQGVQP